ncbi:MAG: mechanosensitive ion channel [Prevotella sp.]|nr:mechanosensitive ion channel [Prevotella sp.]
METIRIFVEDLIQQIGITGNNIHLVRHIVLILVVALLAGITDVLFRRIITPIVDKISSRTSSNWSKVFFGKPVLIAACNIIPAIVVWKLLPLVFYQYPFTKEVVTRLTAIYITIATIHLFIVFINSLNLLDNGERTSVQQYIISFCGMLRIVVIFIGIIIVIGIAIGRSPLTLLAGLGATSAVLMLVFKDTIEGLVAGIRLTSADMMHVGDWITVPGTIADGTVIEMNLTTVKIQNFDNTIVTVSPMALVSGSFQNWKGMQAAAGRRVNRQVFFDFRSIHFVGDDHKETNMTQYRHAMEQYLAKCPWVNTDMSFLVRQKEATQSGLPLEFTFFINDKEYINFEHYLARTMEYAYALAEQYGLKIYQQFPEQ